MVIYKKNRVIYHYEGKKVMIRLIFMVILSNKIMQNYRTFYPQTGVMVNYPDIVVTENRYFLSMLDVIRR